MNITVAVLEYFLAPGDQINLAIDYGPIVTCFYINYLDIEFTCLSC